MRTLAIAAIAVAMTVGGTASAGQRIAPNGGGWKGPVAQPQPMPQMPRPNPGSWNAPKPQPMPQPRPPRPGNPGQWNGNGPRPGNGQWNGGYRGGSRWGGSIGGYWYAGVQAPGGWNGYKQIKRGKRLPGYWASPSFLIGDYYRYGLMAPPAGYYWTRYYNDALLIDRYGVVYDSRPGLDWDSFDGGYGYDDGYADDGYYSDGAGPSGPAYGAPYPAPGYGSSYSVSSGQSRNFVAPPAPRGPAYGTTYYSGPGTTTTIVIPGATTTTTTTTYIEETYVAAKKVYRAPVRKWRPKPRVRCTCTCACPR